MPERELRESRPMKKKSHDVSHVIRRIEGGRIPTLSGLRVLIVSQNNNNPLLAIKTYATSVRKRDGDKLQGVTKKKDKEMQKGAESSKTEKLKKE